MIQSAGVPPAPVGLRLYANGVYPLPDMEIIETSVFTRQIRELMTDDEYCEL